MEQLSALKAAVADPAVALQQISEEGIATGAVWLSTCNRLELYADLPFNCKHRAKSWLLQQFGLEEQPEYMYIHLENGAIWHLLQVAAGLNSAVIGEDQVLQQIREAYKLSTSRGVSSALINRLFHKAIETGKLVRSQTAINKGNTSVASVAIELMEASLPTQQPDRSQPVLLVGAGTTATLIASILSSKGWTHVRIWNRTTAKARKLAAEFGFEAINDQELEAATISSSKIILAVSGKHPVLPLKDWMLQPNAIQMVVDLSMPFQVKDSDLPDRVALVNMNAIRHQQQMAIRQRELSVNAAWNLAETAYHEFLEWSRQQWIGKTLEQWEHLFEQLHQRQLKNFRKTAESETENLEQYGRNLYRSILRQLAWQLRNMEKNDQQAEKISRLLAFVEPYEQLN
ncbi:glutamyl-tRNA reductase [Flavihumibacter rivuli]|nr:glutamyl-tRNA reductase [Flavihumibacter rivuli]ULQ57461.1 glutamyl-tRNA reductase [Flavihumibacter rivuli]